MWVILRFIFLELQFLQWVRIPQSAHIFNVQPSRLQTCK
nr:MAG TPA: hypothetical protein [Caudoviricetes sp.]